MSTHLAIFACLFLPVPLWTVISLMVGNMAREMDLPRSLNQLAVDVGATPVPTHERFSFFSIFAAYRHSFFGIFIAGIILLMFSVENNRDSAGVFFGMSAWYAVLFIVWLNWNYEAYLHVRYSKLDTRMLRVYPGRAYAFTITLAVWSIFCFLTGLISLLR